MTLKADKLTVIYYMVLFDTDLLAVFVCALMLIALL